MKFFKIVMLSLAFVSQAHSQTGPSLKLSDPLPGNLFIELAKAINPAVVNISTETKVRSNLYKDPMMEFLERFYGPGFRMPAPESNTALGTGFVIREDGLIVTNNHVIQGADTVKVSFSDQDDKGITAEVIGSDARTDIALLKIKASKKLPFAILGSSKDVQVGEWVAAFGNPYGHGHTVTKGIISAKGREIGELNRFPFLQTDASINPGNSGGPLVNSKGLVIGVNSAIDARAQGIGFAIPIDEVKSVIADLETNGSVRIGYIGVSTEALDPRVSTYLGLKKDTEGVIISQVLPKGPAARAGIQPYDVITELGGKKIKSPVDLSNTVASTPIGSKVKAKLIRENKELTLEILIAERPSEKKLAMSSQEINKKSEATPFSLGFKLTNIDAKIVKEFGIDESLTGLPIVTFVERGSAAQFAGLRPGDVIFDINRKRVRSSADALKQLRKGTNTIRIQRGDSMGIVAIESPE